MPYYAFQMYTVNDEVILKNKVIIGPETHCLNRLLPQ